MRKLILLAVSGILFFTFNWSEVNAESEALRLAVDSKQVEFSEASGLPYLSDAGRTMMPIRVCLDAIGCEVDWDNTTQIVTTRKGNIEVKIPVGSHEIYINEKPVSTDTAAVLTKGRTYLPLRTVFEAYSYTVDWDNQTKLISALSASPDLRPDQINGGVTGIFSRKQLHFDGFTGIQADVTLPKVTLADQGHLPYVYLGFDWENDKGNAESGFQFIEDLSHPANSHWTVFLRQGDQWRWGDNIVLEQGSTHHLRFYSEKISAEQTDLVIALDGEEVVRHASSVTDFAHASVKSVNAMGMLNTFDGTNCDCRSEGTKIANVQVSTDDTGSKYTDISTYPLYRLWKPQVGKNGILYGTADCIHTYLHFSPDGFQSIYKNPDK